MAATTTDENKAIARRFPEEVATEGRLDVIDEICAADIRDHSPFGEERGREKLMEQAEYLHAAFADLTATVEDAVAEGDTVALRVTVRGTHEGEFMGIEPTGNSFEIPGVVVLRFEDGQVAEAWVNIDALGLLVQLGVVTPPGTEETGR